MASEPESTDAPHQKRLFAQNFADMTSGSELVIGLVGAVGTEMEKVIEVVESRLKASTYLVHHVRVSRNVIPQIVSLLPKSETEDEFSRITRMMDAGNEARRKSDDDSILACGAAGWISSQRELDDEQPKFRPKTAYIINSLKHPEEVNRLREIYPQGFYLIGVHADEQRRLQCLVESKRIEENKARELMARDEHEHIPYGQRVKDTFHMSDFFVRLDGLEDRLRKSTWRILDVLFGHPYRTPTFDEFAMFLAFAASLRSADMSRQVGAVVARDKEIIATGANDCPRFGGGLYWPSFDQKSMAIIDSPNGRDYLRGEDANRIEQEKMIDEIVQISGLSGPEAEKFQAALAESRVRDLTEFGRVVHAEMEALLSCARSNASTTGGTLYCTTFPCHNCAKHIVAAGLKRVVYIEPYEKSKAAELHDDSIFLGFSGPQSQNESKDKVLFEPFVGVGPRRFFDLFSMRIGSGYPLARKNEDGKVMDWKPEEARLRIPMIPTSYLELELHASALFQEHCSGKESKNAK